MQDIKRALILFVLFLLLTTCVVFGDETATGAAVYAGQMPVHLQLDGTPVETDVPPIIEEGRTLIPARALFEAMGATVAWDNEARMVTVAMGNYKVQLFIDSTSAFVNGSRRMLDVPARIVDSRTLIPVRFVAEELQCSVDWDHETRTVLVDSPQIERMTRVHGISYVETETGYRIVVVGDGIFGQYKATAYQDPDRFGIDIFNAVWPDGYGTLETDNEIFHAVRYSQFEEGTVRIVMDLDEKQAGRVSLSEDHMSLFIDFEASKDAEKTEGTGDPDEDTENSDLQDPADETDPKDEDETEGSSTDLEALGLPELDWRMQGKLIYIDPGHGGFDVGSQGKQDGKIVLNEKDVNLAVALRLNELLRAAGANTVMTRDKDVYVTLYDRPAMANERQADLFVSVHNNSATYETPHGTEVHYYSKEGEENYAVDSKTVAGSVRRELLKTLGLEDRGIKSSPALAVLNKTQMPAIIIEGAFLSNAEDLAYMLTDEFVEQYALGAARGILKALNDAVE